MGSLWMRLDELMDASMQNLPRYPQDQSKTCYQCDCHSKKKWKKVLTCYIKECNHAEPGATGLEWNLGVGILGCLPHSQDVHMHRQANAILDTITHYSSYSDHLTILIEACLVYVRPSIECTLLIHTSICVVWKPFSCYTVGKIKK